MAVNQIRESKECEMLLNTTHLCNLRCKYCFVDKGLQKFAGSVPPGVIPELKMGPDTQEACCSFIEHYSEPFDHVTLHFYGGEPFVHFEAMRSMTRRMKAPGCRVKDKISFSVTTNGTLIDAEMIKFLDDFAYQVIVSLDGLPVIHDKMRVGIKGEPTSEKVLETIKLLKSCKNVRLDLSAVIHRENRLKDAYQYLKSFSPNHIKAEYIRVENGNNLDLDEAGKEKYFEDLKLIAEDVVSQLLAGKQPEDYRFNSRVLQMWRNAIRNEFCGAGSSILGIASNGDIFPCTLLIGEKDCCLGNVREGLFPEAVSRFKSWHSFSGKEGCSECEHRYYCGGGCAAMWKTKKRGFCEYIKNEIDLATYIYKRISKEKPEAFALLVSDEFYTYLHAFIHGKEVTDDEAAI